MLMVNEKSTLNKSQHRSMIDDNAEKYENLKYELGSQIS